MKMMKKKPRDSSLRRRSEIQLPNLLLYYFLLGALHEVSHLVTFGILHYPNYRHLLFQDGVGTVLFRTLLLRQCHLPVIDDSEDGMILVRHVGWIFSVLVAVLVLCYNRYCPSNPKRLTSTLQLTAVLTALEAISTDLFGLLTPNNSTILYCGNFGIIVLHEAYWNRKKGRTTALNILEKMIQVTMMRGAQSGGVVSFSSAGKAIRSRVVNGKRGDLSKRLRSKVQRELPPSFPFLAGHTRFATSSKATLEGTHPQQWTPTRKRRVYNFYDTNNQQQKKNHKNHATNNINVENYVTHNGDFEFYVLHGVTYDIERIQIFLERTLHHPMPALVDSCAIAGLVDLLRCQGCFGLSARCALSFLSFQTVSKILSSDDEKRTSFPTYDEFEQIGIVFEDVLNEMQKVTEVNVLNQLREKREVRRSFAIRVVSRLEARTLHNIVKPLLPFLNSNSNNNNDSVRNGGDTTTTNNNDDEEGAAPYGLEQFCRQTIHNFLDNDLLMSVQTFLQNAKGSFGLCVTSSLDAQRQLVLAARGQTMSIAFYPRKELICYGSEQAAVKAGLNYDFPSGNNTASSVLGQSQDDIDNDALRLDLDDLNGEVLVLDWSTNPEVPVVSPPNAHLPQYQLMNGAVRAVLYQEASSNNTTKKAVADASTTHLYHRLTRLTRNRFIRPLPRDTTSGSQEDLIQRDLYDIPRVCSAIQNEWKVEKAAKSLNRLTAYHLSRCLRQRLEGHLNGTITHPQSIDILLTGCEVSLWLAEQFASDLQKSFPRLRVKALSSNKLLGLYGQEIAPVPCFGFPDAPETHHELHDTIVLIVSHSGGTFAPLSCSNLLQSKTKNLFVITSEWDTQIGKQLRAMDEELEEDRLQVHHMLSSRIFSTEIGIRPAEPCSLSVVATHQLLTNLFSYISVILLSDARYRQYTCPTISEYDLQILEKCNERNIDALCEIVSASLAGEAYLDGDLSETTVALIKAGNLWAEHVLENAKAYIITFVYIFGTVISGYPLVYGIAVAAGLSKSTNSDWMIYLIRLFDAAIYFWMPQINIILLRLIQRRNLRHRMVGRTVVIADIPWVAQAGEAFLSKIFACSYSIAGLNVLSGNPADHFVHRHTHRVVRGSLIICGRPDGRLSALSTTEAAVSLSISQASSIQSLGGTCESITIGHNPFQLPLTQNAIILKRKRPLFLCERLLVEADVKEEASTGIHHHRRGSVPPNPMHPQFGMSASLTNNDSNSHSHSSNVLSIWSCWQRRRQEKLAMDWSGHSMNCSVRPKFSRKRSAAALIGAYMNLHDKTNTRSDISNMESSCFEEEEQLSVDAIIKEAIDKKKWSDHARRLFTNFDTDGNGFISLEEFIENADRFNSNFSEEELIRFFELADVDGSGQLDYDEFSRALKTYGFESGIQVPPANRNSKSGLIEIEASRERYFGQTLRKCNAGKNNKDVDFLLSRKQHLSQELYETRIASLQRFVAMTVLFHQMGKRVQEFFARLSFGLLGYRMDRTHSIMRIATTASPISGADVRQRMRHLQLLKKVQHSVHVISTAYLNYRRRLVEVLAEKEVEISGGESTVPRT